MRSGSTGEFPLNFSLASNQSLKRDADRSSAASERADKTRRHGRSDPETASDGCARDGGSARITCSSNPRSQMNHSHHSLPDR